MTEEPTDRNGEESDEKSGSVATRGTPEEANDADDPEASPEVTDEGDQASENEDPIENANGDQAAGNGEEADHEAEEGSAGLSGAFGRGVDRYVLWGALLLSGLLATVAAFNLYFQVGTIIDVWIAGRYQPIFQAGFNLVVLLLAGFVAVTVADRLEVGG